MEKTISAGNGNAEMAAGDRRLLSVAEIKTGRGTKSRIHNISVSLQRLLLLMAAIMMALVTFTACLEDDEKNGGGDDGGDGNGSGVSGKRVKTTVQTATHPIGGPVRSEYTYNSDGTVKQIDNYDESSKIVMRDIITNNSDGTWAKVEQTNLAYAGMVTVLNHTYDNNKKLLKIQGSIYLNEVEVGTTTFDFTFQNGRKISQKQTVYSGGMLSQQLQSEFTYDSNGRRTKTIITPIVGQTVEYTRTYNSDGTLQKVNFIGGDDGNTPITMTITWENGKSTVNMDDIWGW